MEKSDLDFAGKWKTRKVAGRSQHPTIYLFRHAQTFFNRKKYFTG